MRQLLGVLLVLVLAGCGGDGSEGDQAATTTTTTPITTQAPTTTTAEAEPLNLEDWLTITQREYPEVKAMDLDTAATFVGAACVQRANGGTMDDVWDGLAAAIEGSGLPPEVAPGMAHLVGGGMQVVCPRFAPSAP